MTTSIKKIARIGGMLYLIIIVAGIFSELFVRSKLIVSGDATATANNIIASEQLWRMGISGDLIMHICDVPLMLIFYVLLKPVNKNLAFLAVLFNLIQTAVLVANELNLLTPLFLLGGSDYLKAYELHQLQSLAYIAIRSNGYGFGVGLIFFGCECIVLGYLIFRSNYFPRTLGVLMQIAGLCYLTNSFAMLLFPKFTQLLFPAILIPAFVGELLFCLWLLAMGVNVKRWEEKANASRVGM
jgi:hypothetical protein